MNSTSITNLIISIVQDFGVAIFAILSAVIVVGLGMLVFRFGWRRVEFIDGAEIALKNYNPIKGDQEEVEAYLKGRSNMKKWGFNNFD
jgi:hypothetical protein